MVAHVAFNFGLRRKCSNRVDHDYIERTGTHEHVADLEGLFASVGLGDKEAVDIDADGLGVYRVHRMLSIDVGTLATIALRLGNDVGCQGRLTGGLRTVDLGDTTTGKAADTECCLLYTSPSPRDRG